MRVIVCSVLVMLVSVAAGAQETSRAKTDMMLDCVFRGDVIWIGDEFFSDHKVRFSYLVEPRAAPGKGDQMYAAFWDKTRKRGYFLQIGIYSKHGRKDFVLTNEGRIVPSAKGKLELEDTLWGVWTYSHLTKRLHRLENQPVLEARLKEIRRTSAICEWPEMGDIQPDAHSGDSTAKSKNQ